MEDNKNIIEQDDLEDLEDGDEVDEDEDEDEDKD